MKHINRSVRVCVLVDGWHTIQNRKCYRFNIATGISYNTWTRCCVSCAMCLTIHSWILFEMSIFIFSYIISPHTSTADTSVAVFEHIIHGYSMLYALCFLYYTKPIPIHSDHWVVYVCPCIPFHRHAIQYIYYCYYYLFNFRLFTWTLCACSSQ